MAEGPGSALDARERTLVENAREALASGCYDYAIAACAEVLETQAGCVSVRRIQSEAWVRRSRERSRFAVRLSGWSALLRAGLSLRRGTPGQRLKLAERVLEADPANRQGWRVLAEAASALGFWETAVFARETLRELAPADRENLLALGEALLAADDTAAALDVADSVLESGPHDAAATDLMRRASVAETMARGRWEEEGSFREKLRQAKDAPPRAAADHEAT